MSDDHRMRSSVDQTVVSVGPYRFHKALQRDSSRVASALLRVSPPHSAVSSGSPRQPASNSIAQVAGTACIRVGRLRRMRSISAGPSSSSCGGASSRRAPTVSGRKNSRAAMSNDGVASDSSVSPASQPGSRCIETRKLTSARCEMSTPLGSPVDPEVYST